MCLNSAPDTSESDLERVTNTGTPNDRFIDDQYCVSALVMGLCGKRGKSNGLRF